jgi:hypothetical protein
MHLLRGRLTPRHKGALVGAFAEGNVLQVLFIAVLRLRADLDRAAGPTALNSLSTAAAPNSKL